MASRDYTVGSRFAQAGLSHGRISNGNPDVPPSLEGETFTEMAFFMSFDIPDQNGIQVYLTHGPIDLRQVSSGSIRLRLDGVGGTIFDTGSTNIGIGSGGDRINILVIADTLNDYCRVYFQTAAGTYYASDTLSVAAAAGLFQPDLQSGMTVLMNEGSNDPDEAFNPKGVTLRRWALWYDPATMPTFTDAASGATAMADFADTTTREIVDPAVSVAAFGVPDFDFYGPEAARGYNHGSREHFGVVWGVAEPENFTYTPVNFASGGMETVASGVLDTGDVLVFAFSAIVPTTRPAARRRLAMGGFSNNLTSNLDPNGAVTLGLRDQTNLAGRVSISGIAPEITDSRLTIMAWIDTTNNTGELFINGALVSSTVSVNNSFAAPYEFRKRLAIGQNVGGGGNEMLDYDLERCEFYLVPTGTAISLADFETAGVPNHPVDAAAVYGTPVRSFFGPEISYGIDKSGNNNHLSTVQPSTGGLKRIEDLSGVKLAYDPSNLNALSLSSDNITDLRDLGSGGYDLSQNTGSGQLTYDGYIGGLRTARVNDTSEHFDTLVIDTIGGPELAVLWLYQPGDTSGVLSYQRPVALDGPGNEVIRFERGSSHAKFDADLGIYPPGGAFTFNVDNPVGLTQAHVLVGHIELGRQKLRQDGEVIRDSGTQSPNFGASWGPVSLVELFGRGVGEHGAFVILENTDVDTIQEAEGIVAWQYGLEAALPDTHPYRAAPPIKGVEAPVQAVMAVPVGEDLAATTSAPSLSFGTNLTVTTGGRALLGSGQPSISLGWKSDASTGSLELGSFVPSLINQIAYSFTVQPASARLLAVGSQVTLKTLTPLVSHSDRIFQTQSGSRTLVIEKEKRDGSW